MNDLSSGQSFILQLSKMDVYIEKELKEKTGRIVFFTLLLLIPNLFIKAIALLFLSASLLVYDIRHQEIELLYVLPFSRKELFFYNIVFLGLIVIVTSAFGEIFSGSALIYKFEFILRSLILLFSIFGLQMLFSEFNIDGLTFSIFAVILDAVLGSFGTTEFDSSTFNPYSLISFTRQGNLVLSLLFSFLICFIGYWLYTRRDGEKSYVRVANKKSKQTD
ncbi:hypothetical protein PQ743_10535 [Thermoanaerobacterium thermosaccharolyticum]|uniref:hypothetical protein n=1 Tax=Thermoanaerobacterium thermosaccharolyticum TaxID=1517 RepID=UPI003DA9FA1B